MSKPPSDRSRDAEMKEFRTIASTKQITVAEWVRGSLRNAKTEEPAADPHRKLQAVRSATAHSFPTADIDEMLGQIERGYKESA